MVTGVLSALPPIVADYLGWWIAALIVVVGLVGFGLKDVARFSGKRIWAISSVCFAESIRRRVLWITPLAIIGVIIVAQLQKPIDEQDAIRQTIKFCLFATGMVVTIATIILACTNLPREIDSRVIYTIVTKPTTRLELVLGKIVGFARVSGAILVIMGLFTFVYVHIRAWDLRRDVAARLEAGLVDEANAPTLRHYAQPGTLLAANTYRQADRLDIYARLPQEGDRLRWVLGSSEQEVLVPFDLRRSDLIPVDDPTQTPGSMGLVILAHAAYEQRVPTQEEIDAAPSEAPQGTPQMPPMMPPGPGGAPSGAPVTAPVAPIMLSILPVQDTRPAPATGATTSPPPATSPAAAVDQRRVATRPLQPRLRLAIVNRDLFPVVSARDINEGRPLDLPPLDPGQRLQSVQVVLPPDKIARLLGLLEAEDEPQRFYVLLQGTTPGVTYGFGPNPAQLVVPGLNPDQFNILSQATETVRGEDGQEREVLVEPLFRGRTGTHGQQLRGPVVGQEPPVAVYRFRDAELPGTDQVPFEMRVGVERSGEELVDSEEPTRVAMQVHNLQTNQTSPEIVLSPETNRRIYFSVPATAVEGGDFDVILRTLTPGHYVGLWTPPAEKPSLVLVSDQQSFGYNLAKSLLIMWLLMMLVIIISIFCSTFLSWPIAIVLTLLILLGRWGVEQIGATNLGPGIGAQVATEMGLSGAAPARVVSESVEALTRMLKIVAAVLPDISKFPTMEAIERGMTVPAASIGSALMVLLGYGLPMTVLTYVFLKNKEVAP